MSDGTLPDDLIREHYGRIRRAAGLLCGCTWDADDLTQETFVRASAAWNRCQRKEQPFVWLYSILLNVDRSRRRSLRNWLKHRAGLAHRSAGNTTQPDIRLQSDFNEESQTLWQEVARLSPRLRQVLVMRFAEQWSYQQIAEALQCREVTVRTQLCRALQKLRAMCPSADSDTRAIAETTALKNKNSRPASGTTSDDDGPPAVGSEIRKDFVLRTGECS